MRPFRNSVIRAHYVEHNLIDEVSSSTRSGVRGALSQSLAIAFAG